MQSVFFPFKNDCTWQQPCVSTGPATKASAPVLASKVQAGETSKLLHADPLSTATSALSLDLVYMQRLFYLVSHIFHTSPKPPGLPSDKRLQNVRPVGSHISDFSQNRGTRAGSRASALGNAPLMLLHDAHCPSLYRPSLLIAHALLVSVLENWQSHKCRVGKPSKSLIFSLSDCPRSAAGPSKLSKPCHKAAP